MSVSRKNLPKAITRATEDMREAIAARGAREQQEALARSMDLNALSDREAAAAPQPHPASVDAPPAPPPTPVAGALARAASPAADIHAARRRSLARTVVERHAAYAAVGGVIPVPIANVAGITAVIVRMVRMLSDLYGVPFERDRARAIVVGLMGGAMPTGLGAVTTSTLVYVVPGSVLIGLAVSSIAAAACTRSIGLVFVEHFESGATLHDLPATGTT
jgi:uncharacterized protein (DUF697 family)